MTAHDMIRPRAGIGAIAGAVLAGVVAALAAAAGPGAAAAQEPGGVTCNAGEVCRVDATFQPLRALARPNSVIYREPSDAPDARFADANPFKPMYVFARQDVDLSDPANPTGWYQIGPSPQNPLGWMKAIDIIEWRQALLVAYTHPGQGADARKPVLMFSDLDALKATAEGDPSAAQALYDELDNQQKPDGVISSEPTAFVDIDNPDQFYILPVVEWEFMDLYDYPARYLRLAAATPGARAATDASGRVSEGTLDDVETLSEAGAAMSETVGQSEVLRNLQVDLVFVVDMTGSMGPYMDAVRKAMTDIATRLGQEQGIKLGLVGYRDDVNADPGLEFVARNFTPELIDAAAMVDLIGAQAIPSTISSGDYQEEVFAGFQTALESSWRENSVRLMVLLGDASSHVVGNPKNTTGLNAEELRIRADQAKAYVTAVHLEDPLAEPDWALAEDQYRKLAQNPGSEAPAFSGVDATNSDAIEVATRQIVENLAAVIAAAQGGDVATVAAAASGEAPAAAAGGSGNAEADEITAAAQQAFAGALINYLGQEANPPRDITAWAIDRDMTDPAKQSLDVRVLISRQEVSNLAGALELILDAIRTREMVQTDFFSALQALSAQVSGGNDVSADAAQKLGQSAFLPRWLDALPYRSKIAALSPQEFEAYTAEEQQALELELDSKLQLYRVILEDVNAWRPLDEQNDAQEDYVTALTLAALP